MTERYINLREINELYTDPQYGLIKIAKEIGLDNIEEPATKLNILLIGNNSTGKSSFINWYIGENLINVDTSSNYGNKIIYDPIYFFKKYFFF